MPAGRPPSSIARSAGGAGSCGRSTRRLALTHQPAPRSAGDRRARAGGARRRRRCGADFPQAADPRHPARSRRTFWISTSRSSGWRMRSRPASGSASSPTTTSTARPRRRCSAAILRAIGAASTIDVPDRLREGYGPTRRRSSGSPTAGCSLVVTLDSGTTAFEALGIAAERGQEVIVVDHHAAEPRLPSAARRDQSEPLRPGQRARPSRCGRRDLSPGRRAQSGRCARAAISPAGAGAGPAPLAGPGRSGHGLRRGAADRAQSRVRGAGPPGRGARRQSRDRAARRRSPGSRRSRPATISASRSGRA